MKVDFAAVITALDGQPIVNEQKEPFTLGMAAVNALLQPADANMQPMEKVRRARLAERAYDALEVELSPEDVTLIRSVIGQMYPPLIVMKAFRLLGDEATITSLKAV